MRKSMKAFICGTDWIHEWSEKASFMDLYSSVKKLKADRDCWRECGIIELELTVKRWVVKEDFGYYQTKPKRKKKK